MKKFFALVFSLLLAAVLIVPASAHGHGGGHHGSCPPSCDYALPDWAGPDTNGVVPKRIWGSEAPDASASATYEFPDWAEATPDANGVIAKRIWEPDACYRLCLHGDEPPCSSAGQSGFCGGYDPKSHVVTSIFSPIFNHICCIH